MFQGEKGRRTGLESTECFETICMRDLKGNDNYENIYNLLILSLLFGIIMGVPSPPFWTIVINTFGKNNLSKINSYFYSFQFFGEMIIPLIFAFIISNFSSNYFISFACFIILIATFLIYYFPEDKQLKNQKDIFLEELKETQNNY